jgi:hypothetical protein
MGEVVATAPTVGSNVEVRELGNSDHADESELSNRLIRGVSSGIYV